MYIAYIDTHYNVIPMILDVPCCTRLYTYIHYIGVNIFFFFREFSILLHTRARAHNIIFAAYDMSARSPVLYIGIFYSYLFIFFIFCVFYAFSKTTAWARCHVPRRSAVCSPAADNAPYSTHIIYIYMYIKYIVFVFFFF